MYVLKGIYVLRLCCINPICTQKPDLVAAEGKILHAQRKHRNHQTTYETITKDAKKQEDKLAALRKDLADVVKAAEGARGMFLSSSKVSTS